MLDYNSILTVNENFVKRKIMEYHDSLLNCNIEYEHPYVTRWASLRDPYICKKFEKRNNKLINKSNQEINHKINVVKITAACIGLFVSKILFKLVK